MTQPVHEKSIWTSRELAISLGVGALSTAVAAVALHRFKEHQALMAKSPFLRMQQPFVRSAIEALPGKEQQLLQAAYEAKVMAGIYDLQIKAIELAGPESRLWNADQWLVWMKENPLEGMKELTAMGSHMLDEKRIVAAWVQMGPHEELVQFAGNLQDIAPKESASWFPDDWLAWLQDEVDLTLPEAQIQELVRVIFVRRHREVYRNFLTTARRSIGPQWENWSVEQWLAHIQQAPKNPYHPLHSPLRPLIESSSPFCGVTPESPVTCRVDPEHFFEILASDLATRRDPLALGILENESALWNVRHDAWALQLTEAGRKLLDQTIVAWQ